jgi:hypothetical protein
MALNQWFKFYGGEYLSDPKIASLSPQERSCWLTLLCLASISSKPGTVEYLTTDALLQKSGITWDPYHPEEWDNAQTVLDKFVRMKMITKSDEGVMEMLNWQKRQEMTALTNAERQANYRKRNGSVMPVATNITVDKNRIDKINTPSADAREVSEGILVEETQERVKREPKYPHSKEVFALWGEYPKHWEAMKEVKQRAAAEDLYNELGIEEIKNCISFLKEHMEEDFCPKIYSPADLREKYPKLEAYSNKT